MLVLKQSTFYLCSVSKRSGEALWCGQYHSSHLISVEWTQHHLHLMSMTHCWFINFVLIMYYSYLMFKSCAMDVISSSVIALGSHQNSTLHPILAFICHDYQSSDKRKIYHMVLILVQSCIDDSSTFIFIAPFLKNLLNCPLISLTRRSHFDCWIIIDRIPCIVIV